MLYLLKDMSQAKKETTTFCYNFTANISMQQDMQKETCTFQHLPRMLQIIANLALDEDCMTIISTPNFMLPLTATAQSTAQLSFHDGPLAKVSVCGRLLSIC